MLKMESPVVLESKPRPLMEVSALMTEELRGAMSRLGDVPGMDWIIRYVSSGQFIDHLSLQDLGASLLETMTPELHYVLMEAATCLGLEVTPDIFEHPALTSAQHTAAALLHIPHVSSASLVATAASAAAGSNGGLVPRLPDGSFGWRRRAVVLLRPGLLFELTPLEVQAVLALALGPMCLPGGGGWKLDLLSQTGASGPSNSMESYNRSALADIVTAVGVSMIKPLAMRGQQPKQLQVKWERMLRLLQYISANSGHTCDRVALLVVQQIAPVVTAIFKTCAGLPPGRCPSAEALILEADSFQTPPHDPLPFSSPAPSTPVELRSAALTRIKQLKQWHDSSEYRRLLQSGSLLRNVVASR